MSDYLHGHLTCPCCGAVFEVSETTLAYESFTEKFEVKKTTDDCYTPEPVYEAVANFVAEEYGIDRSSFVRPFYPGGDYQSFEYPAGSVVVDNPPFSLFTEILRFYNSRKIPYFLFGPHLTLFNYVDKACCIPCGVTVTYENGAKINTSFVTSLEPDLMVKCSGRLYDAAMEADNKNRNQGSTKLPRYKYPLYVLRSTDAEYFSRYGIPFCVPRKCAKPVKALDSQMKSGKSIFGGGILLSKGKTAEREKAEREKATVWELSERERGIIRGLSRYDD